MEGSQLMEALRAQFPDAVVELDEDNRPYIPPDHVEQRLDEVVGPENWTWAVTDVLAMTADGRFMDPKVAGCTEPAAWLVVRGRLSLAVGERTTFRDGEGSARIHRHKGKDEVVDPGDNVKGAASSAFKKAALRFGIGAYLRDPAAKNRLRARQRYAERNGGRTDEADTRVPAPSRQGGGDRRSPTQGARQPGSAAPAPAGKELQVRVVEAPKRQQDTRSCEVVVEDGKGNRAVLVARRPGLVATLAEVKPGAVLTVRGQIRTEDGRPLPVFEASDLVIPQPGAGQGGEAGTFGGERGARKTYAVRLVGQVEKSKDSKSGRAVVADADGSKAVLVTDKPALTAILAAQKPDTRLTVVGDLRNEGSELLLVAASVRPAGESAA